MAFEAISVRDVQIISPFWTRIQTSAREKILPSIIDSQKSLDHWPCLTWKRDHPTKPHPFWDSDIYKIVEAACYLLVNHPDEKILAVVEEAVDMITAAQYEDGYISSYFTVHGIEKRWTNLRDLHELYCLGHLLEATVAYEELTGSGRLSRVAEKVITHVSSVFGRGPGQKRGYPGHQEIEIGLLRFHELTGNVSALELARYFITERGRKDEKGEIYFDGEARARGADPYDDMGSEHKAWFHGCRDYGYQQAALPLIESTEVEGHSVRAMYFYTAATDLVRLSSESNEEAVQIKDALDRLWKNLITSKIYVTGGIGSITNNEGFGKSYVLGDLECQGCYAETCATFGLINWCARLLRLRLNVEYADVMENCLYNGLLGAVNTEGDAFYYQNVLRTLGGQPKERSRWFGVACCPPNVAKLLGSLGNLIYSVNTEKTLVAIHLYIGSILQVPGTGVTINQESELPWSGKVSLKVDGTIGLALRIPNWATSYTCSAKGEVRDGYLHIPPFCGEIALEFPLSAQKIYANPKTDKDEICIARGPLIYCIEDVDNCGIDIDSIALVDSEVADGAEISVSSFKGITTVTTKCRELASQNASSLYSSRAWQYGEEEKEVVAIPYFLRANRPGNGVMRVWTKRLPGQQLKTNGWH